MTHISSLYSYNSLGKAVDSNENTMQQFLHILQNAYFIDELKQFSYSLKIQTHARKKVYCIDNGLIAAATFKFSHNHGKLLENLVYTELRKRGYNDIFFFNDQKECDFIIHQENDTKAIQVCYDLNDDNRQRELNGLKTAMEKFSIADGFIITYDQEEVIDKHINVVPFWKFFSEDYHI
jgi:uncharacterized protein